jgi:hypothetical protein
MMANNNSHSMLYLSGYQGCTEDSNTIEGIDGCLSLSAVEPRNPCFLNLQSTSRKVVANSVIHSNFPAANHSHQYEVIVPLRDNHEIGRSIQLRHDE